MDISIFRHFTNSFHGNQLFCIIRDTFKMKEGFLLERGFNILNISVLVKNLMCTEVVSTRLPESLYITVSLIQKTTQKQGTFSS